MDSVRHTVPAGIRAMRADKALASAYPEHSRSALQRSFDADLVHLNGKPAERSSTVRSGDILEFSFPKVKASELRPVAIALEVLHEDRWIVAINKPAGMVVHPGAGTDGNTLVHALLAHCPGDLSGIGGIERPGIVHRLDRETSGVIIVAKTDAAHRALAGQFADRKVLKEYVALVTGIPRLSSGSVKKAIGRNPRHRHKMAVLEEERGGRPSWTDWEIGERFGTVAAKVRCVLHTGRTHQIRVHMAALGHPLLGDRIYGWKPGRDEKTLPTRVMLHAEHLLLTHPGNGKPLDLLAPMPPDMRRLIAALRYSVGSKANRGSHLS